MNRNRARTTAALAIAGILLVGCAPAADEAESTPTPDSTPSPAPSPTQVYAEPDDVLEGEIARATYAPDGGEDDSPVSSSTVVDVVVADEPFLVDGQCIGGQLQWEVNRAAPDSDGSTLMAGTLVCGDEAGHTSFSSAYGGPVQVSITSTDDVEAAWLVVLPADFP